MSAFEPATAIAIRSLVGRRLAVPCLVRSRPYPTPKLRQRYRAPTACNGLCRDTTNQFRGEIAVPLRLAMYALILCEIGGFLVPFTGFVHARF